MSALHEAVRSAQTRTYRLTMTTQGPTYPPSEIMDADGNFVVIGRVNRAGDDGGLAVRDGARFDVAGAHGNRSRWGAAIVSADSPLPPFGENAPYDIVRELDLDALDERDRAAVLYTLPVPLPCNNYPMLFAPEQNGWGDTHARPSYPLHAVPIPDLRPEDGRSVTEPITLGDWIRARGEFEVSVSADGRSATFAFEFAGLIPRSLYTMMSLREHDFDPQGPTRPGPLGVPNVFVTDDDGAARYRATLPNPFPADGGARRNRIVNVVLLWMSYQVSYGGAMAIFGLGGDVHAQLKLTEPSFFELETRA